MLWKRKDEAVVTVASIDAHIGYRIAHHLDLPVEGRNLLQARHAEFAGDNSNATRICRRVTDGLLWGW